jgi:hypothetical protein
VGDPTSVCSREFLVGAELGFATTVTMRPGVLKQYTAIIRRPPGISTDNEFQQHR